MWLLYLYIGNGSTIFFLIWLKQCTITSIYDFYQIEKENAKNTLFAVRY